MNRVCKVSEDGGHIINSHGGRPGSDIGQYDVPRHLAVDDNEFVYVADRYNHRVTLLSSTLGYIRQVVSPTRHQLLWSPRRMCLDVQRRRLYVSDSEYKDDEDDEEVYACYSNAGRVLVFTV